MKRLTLAVLAALLVAISLSAQKEVFENNAASTLATAIDADDTSVVVQTGHGARFPAITGSDYFYITVENGPPVTAREIMQVTARSGDTLTVVRAQQGTTGTAFGTGVKVEQRLTRSTLNSLRDIPNVWFLITGPTAPRTYSVPDANAAILTDNADVTIAQGGTGASTAAAGFDALAPTTTNGDVIIRAAGSNTRLGIGSDGNVLTVSSGAPVWSAPAGGINIVTGASAAHSGNETWHSLTANCAANATTTPAVCMTTTGLTAGTYIFEYAVVYQSSATGNGVNFQVNYTGTVTRFRAIRRMHTTGTTASSGVSDQVAAVLTGSLMEAMATRTDSGSLGPNTGVDTANADILENVWGVMNVSGSGSLELLIASEAAVSVQLMADTVLLLKKVN